MEDTKKYTPANYKSDQYVRWCPGCGDHAVLNVLHIIGAAQFGNLLDF